MKEKCKVILGQKLSLKDLIQSKKNIHLAI